MIVTALGHAGLLVEADRTLIAIDPWLDPAGAFASSWFQYPSNDGLDVSRVLGADAIVITHEHLDHLDPWTLRRIPRDTPVYVPRFASTAALRAKLGAAGAVAATFVEPWTWHPIGDVEILFAPEASPMNHDSAVAVRAGDGVLVDLNDARLTPVQIRRLRAEVVEPIDLLALQGAGASWYPLQYAYDAARKRRLVTDKRAAKLRYVKLAIGAAEPRCVLPFAGPPCFLDPDLRDLNAEIPDGIFPHQNAVAEWLGERGVDRAVVLLPGDEIEASTLTGARSQTWEGFFQADTDAYLRDYAERKAPEIAATLAEFPHPSSPLDEAVSLHFGELARLSGYFDERIGITLALEATGPNRGEWTVDFSRPHDPVRRGGGPAGYRFVMQSRWLHALTSRRIAWEDFLLSMRFTADRSPDNYNDHLLGLLKFADAEALDAVERFESAIDLADRTTVTWRGQTYVVSRFCPHAGGDLSELGVVLDSGRLQCLAHHYEFDLTTGECVTGRCPPISVETLSSDDGTAPS